MTSQVERLAMELRQIQAEDDAEMSGNKYSKTAEQTWAGASDLLRKGYRRDAERILRLLRRLDSIR